MNFEFFTAKSPLAKARVLPMTWIALDMSWLLVVVVGVSGPFDKADAAAEGYEAHD